MTDAREYKTKALAMLVEGVPIVDVATRLGSSYGRAYGVYKRAVARGDIEPCEKARTIPIRSRQKIASLMDTRLGTMSEIANGMTQEVFDFWLSETVKNGYASMAEALLDAAVDKYFEN